LVSDLIKILVNSKNQEINKGPNTKPRMPKTGIPAITPKMVINGCESAK
jgi:hypothetical protein